MSSAILIRKEHGWWLVFLIIWLYWDPEDGLIRRILYRSSFASSPTSLSLRTNIAFRDLIAEWVADFCSTFPTVHLVIEVVHEDREFGNALWMQTLYIAVLVGVAQILCLCENTAAVWWHRRVGGIWDHLPRLERSTNVKATMVVFAVNIQIDSILCDWHLYSKWIKRSIGEFSEAL